MRYHTQRSHRAEGHQMRSKKHRSGGQSGAALVEMAIVLPLLMMLVFGIIEFGLAFNVRLTVGNATQSSARVGSAIGTGDRADIEILDSLKQGLFQLPNNGDDIVKEVWIFDAPASGDVPGVCDTSSCNVYVFDAVSTCKWSPCPNPDTPVNYEFPPSRWDPEDRKTTVGDLGDLGVVVFFSHDWVVGSLLPMSDVPCTSPPSGCWSDTAIMRLEPEQFGTGA